MHFCKNIYLFPIENHLIPSKPFVFVKGRICIWQFEKVRSENLPSCLRSFLSFSMAFWIWAKDCSWDLLLLLISTDFSSTSFFTSSIISSSSSLTVTNLSSISSAMASSDGIFPNLSPPLAGRLVRTSLTLTDCTSSQERRHNKTLAGRETDWGRRWGQSQLLPCKIIPEILTAECLTAETSYCKKHFILVLYCQLRLVFEAKFYPLSSINFLFHFINFHFSVPKRRLANLIVCENSIFLVWDALDLSFYPKKCRTYFSLFRTWPSWNKWFRFP